jgi:hypothetical protein
MTKGYRHLSRLTSLERRRAPETHIVVTWGDDEDQIVTDLTGEKITLAEWRKRHPDSKEIQLTWGDDPDIDEVNQ